MTMNNRYSQRGGMYGYSPPPCPAPRQQMRMEPPVVTPPEPPTTEPPTTPVPPTLCAKCCLPPDVCPSPCPDPIWGMPLASSYVPMQQWGETYSSNSALCRGTIFPCLDLPFLMGGCRQ